MKMQKICQHFLLLMTLNNAIHKAMLKQKFCSLKACREALSCRLLYNTRSRKTNKCLWLCQNNISLHSKACRHTACCWVSKHTYI